MLTDSGHNDNQDRIRIPWLLPEPSLGILFACYTDCVSIAPQKSMCHYSRVSMKGMTVATRSLLVDVAGRGFLESAGPVPVPLRRKRSDRHV